MGSFPFGDALTSENATLIFSSGPVHFTPDLDIPTQHVQVPSSLFDINERQQRLSKIKWEELRPLIRRLYIEEKRTSGYVAQIIGQECGFIPTKRQLDRKLKLWGFTKNVHRKGRTDAAGRVTAGASLDEEPPEFAAIQYGSEIGYDHLENTQLSSLRATGNGDFSPDQSGNQRNSHPIVPGQDQEIPARDMDFQPASPRNDQWPFHESKIDVIGSPNLSRLFAALEIECHDIPPLDLPPPNITRAWPPKTHCISISEFPELSRANNRIFTDVAGEVPYNTGHQNLVRRAPKLQNTQDRALKYPGRDVLFPSEIYVYSSPWNELYPFPDYPGRARFSSSPTQTSIAYQKATIEQSKEKLSKLQDHFPENHPLLVRLMKAQAEAYFKMRWYSQSEFLYRKILKATKLTCDSNSEEVLQLSYKLAWSIFGQGNRIKADEMHRAIHIKILNSFAPDHWLVLSSLHFRSEMARCLGEFEEAEAIHRQGVQIQLVSHGPKHLDALGALLSMAIPKLEKGELCQSERIIRTTLQLYDLVSCNQHTHIEARLMTARWLARSLMKQGRYDESREVCEVAIDQATSSLGSEHIHTLILKYELARILRNQGHIRDSESIFREVLRQQSSLYDENSFETRSTIRELARLLKSLQQHDEATVLYERVFKGSRDSQGLDHHETVNDFFDLGESYDAEKRYEDTEAISKEYLDVLRVLEGHEGPTVAKVERWMRGRAELLEKWRANNDPNGAGSGLDMISEIL